MTDFLLGFVQRVREMDVDRLTIGQQALLILAWQRCKQLVLNQNGIRG